MNNNFSIVLFDGECNFCNSTIYFIFKRDRKNKFKFCSLQSERGKKMLEKFNILGFNNSSMVLISNNCIHSKSGAALRIAKELTGIWPLLYFFIIVPYFLRDWIYTLVAKRRHRFLTNNKCVVADSKFKAAILD